MVGEAELQQQNVVPTNLKAMAAWPLAKPYRPPATKLGGQQRAQGCVSWVGKWLCVVCCVLRAVCCVLCVRRVRIVP